MLNGDRTLLRLAEEADASFFFQVLNNRELVDLAFFPLMWPQTIDGVKDWIKEWNSSARYPFGRLFVSEPSNRGEPIGFATIYDMDWKNKNAQLGVGIANVSMADALWLLARLRAYVK